MRSTLIINNKPPYSSQAAKEAQDATLAFAAFGVPMAVLFLGDGVFQLLRGQCPAPGLKNTSAALESYPLYDINELYVCEEDLVERQLEATQLLGKVSTISRQQIQTLLSRFDNLLTF